MSVVTRTEYRFSEPGDRGKRLAVSYGASIAINALFLALMIVGIDVHRVPLSTVETPVEIIIEASPKVDSPIVQSADAPVRDGPIFPQPLASLNARPKYGFDPREIADKERQQKAAPDTTTVDGDGTAKSRTATPSENTEERDGEELKKTKIAPPGPDSKPTAKDEPKDNASDETTAKRQQIECGANAKFVTWSAQPQRRGQVLGRLTKDQANRMIQMTQANRDMFISPDYVDNVRVYVHVDGTPDGAWLVVLLPPGLSAQAGDRVEFAPGHLDPSHPCHYIPNLVSRVL